MWQGKVGGGGGGLNGKEEWTGAREEQVYVTGRGVGVTGRSVGVAGSGHGKLTSSPWLCPGMEMQEEVMAAK